MRDGLAECGRLDQRFLGECVGLRRPRFERGDLGAQGGILILVIRRPALDRFGVEPPEPIAAKRFDHIGIGTPCHHPYSHMLHRGGVPVIHAV